jgi:hypothetical protein
LQDGRIVASTVSGADANFSMTLSGLSAGSYVFGVYAKDVNQIQSAIQSFPIRVTAGVTVNVGGLFISPTITADKTQVKKGDNITFFGQSLPSSAITISVNSIAEVFNNVNSDQNGVYLDVFDSSVLDLGSHLAKSKAAQAAQISEYGGSFNFSVGSANILVPPNNPCPLKGDLNNDCKVNLVDFSIAAFGYNKPLNPQTLLLEASKLNGDGKIDLVDFSIMAFYWTG